MSTTALRKKPRDKDLRGGNAPRRGQGRSPDRRPFDAKILARAREIAADYQIVLWFEDGEYYGRGVELPMTFADGKTPDQCVASTRQALTTTVALMLERGESPPPPALEAKRTEQINLRVSAEEKLRIESLARQRGYKGIADFVRAAALAG